jgi:predicted RNase H-like HicB family nuclease
MKWLVIVHEAEEGGYWGEVPALPGCISEGETLEEFEANIKDAIEGCIAARQQGASGAVGIRMEVAV